MPTGHYPRRHYAGRRLLTREQLEVFAGMLAVDIAAELKCSRHVVQNAIKRHRIRHLFPARGGAATQIARKGYCW